MNNNGDVAAQRTAAAMQRAQARQNMQPRAPQAELTPDESGDDDSQRALVQGINMQNAADAPTAQQQQQVVINPQQESITEEPPEEPVADPLAEMRTLLEQTARANLSDHGIDLYGSPPVQTPAPQQPAQQAPIQQAEQPVQRFSPQFNIQITQQDYDAAMQSPTGLQSLLVKAAQAGYDQARMATLQEDVPVVTKATNDYTNRQVQALQFFMKYPDLTEYPGMVRIAALQLRQTGKYTDADTLMADTAKQVRHALRINGQAVKAAESVASIQPGTMTPNPAPATPKRRGAAFAGGGQPQRKQTQKPTNNNGKPKSVGDDFAEDVGILMSGLN